jgi:hypothetical protein
VTEAELRKLSEEGRACRLILGAELERLEGRLGKLDADSASSLGAIADAFRRVHDLRAHVEELDELLPRSRIGHGTSERAGSDR